MRTLLLALNVLAPLALAGLALSGQFWIGLAILFVVHMLTLVATLVPACPWWGEVVTSFDGSDEVSLTIDDGPDPEDSAEILRILEDHGAKATFFFIGEKVQRHPGLVRQLHEAGHRIENHTQSHDKFSFWRFGPRKLRAEIRGAQQQIESATGRPPQWFRAPAGMRNAFVHPILKKLGLRLLGWSVRGRDGVSTDREAIVARLAAGIEPGAILLMHEGMRDEEGKSVIVDTLPRVLAEIEKRSLRATVSP